jgi:hypothetical protein
VRLKSIATSAIWFCLFALVQVAAAAPSNDPCDLPKDLQREVAIKYPGKRVVTLDDLQDDDRRFFQSDHGKSCPGLVRVDFYGDGLPTLAFVLVTKGSVNERTDLVVAHQVGQKWGMSRLGTGGPNAPVVWRQPPGKYQDVYGNKSIRAIRPVIVFCQYESWAVLYAWSGHGVDKIWLSD